MRFLPNALLQAAICSALFIFAEAAVTDNGEEARWLINNSNWGTLSNIVEGEVNSMPTSFADSDGRIFFYIMKEGDSSFKASLTLSEAQIDPTQFDGAKCGPGGDLDPEDPRCGKLTITGTVSVCDDESKQLALDTLFARHPQMANWPEDHGFFPMEMIIKETDGLWMIANFGGGGFMQAEDYFDSTPVHHAMKGFGGGRNRHLRSLEEKSSSCYDMAAHTCECVPEKCGGELCGAAGGVWSDQCPGSCDCEPASVPQTGEKPADTNDSGETSPSAESKTQGAETGEKPADTNDSGETSPSAESKPQGAVGGGSRPDFGDDGAGHARWLVAKSLWTTISTSSSRDEGFSFGNIRSVADGACFLGSSGLPYFYVPAPDPTAKDIEENALVTLSFSEAVLAERVGEDGVPCGGKDAEDPTCAKIVLTGHARAVEDDDKIELAKASFKAQHPLASWLASGGGHTGGSYYTLHLHSITFLRTYGGFTELTPEDYLNWKPDASKFEGEETCDSVGAQVTGDQGGGEGHQHEQGGGGGGEGQHHGMGGQGGGEGHQHGQGGGGGEAHHHGMGTGGQQTQATPAFTNGDSSISAGTVLIICLSAFVGSIFAAILPERVRSYLGGRNHYSVAQSEDQSLKLAVTSGQTC